MALTTDQMNYIRSLYATDQQLQAIVGAHGMLAFQLASVEVYNENAVALIAQQAAAVGSISSPSWATIRATVNATVDVSLTRQIATELLAKIEANDATDMLPLLIGLLTCVRTANSLPAVPEP